MLDDDALGQVPIEAQLDERLVIIVLCKRPKDTGAGRGDGEPYWPELDIDLSAESIRHPEKYPLISKAVATGG